LNLHRKWKGQNGDGAPDDRILKTWRSHELQRADFLKARFIMRQCGHDFAYLADVHEYWHVAHVQMQVDGRIGVHHLDLFQEEKERLHDVFEIMVSTAAQPERLFNSAFHVGL
jgi:hypothetical protein